MVNKFLIILLMLINRFGFAQYDSTFLEFTRSKNIFNKIEGTFFDKVKSVEINNEVFNYMYQFNDSLDIQIWYPFNTDTSECNYFIINKQQINLDKLFENDFACDLDITSLSIYKAEFNRKKFLLITGINNGSGDYVSTVICHLFDITNQEKISYYPLWSKYGGTSCFGDFNNNGKLDFLKVRNYQGSRFVYVVTLMELTNNCFENIDESKYFIILKKELNGSFKIIKNKWFY